MTELRTARLILRQARSSDLAALHKVYSNLDAMRYWSTEPHEGFDDTITLVMQQASQPEPVSYLVIEMGGTAIGCCGVFERDEIGFILHPDFWRRGIMREALDAYIAYARDVLGLGRLTAEVDPRNAASIGLLTGLGFAETHRAEKTIFLYGEWCDSVYFALEDLTTG